MYPNHRPPINLYNVNIKFMSPHLHVMVNIFGVFTKHMFIAKLVQSMSHVLLVMAYGPVSVQRL